MSTGESYDRYLNFPIELLQGLMIDSKKCLNDVMDYAIYAHTEKYYHLRNVLNEWETDEEKEKVISNFKDAASYFGIKLGSVEGTIKNGRNLYRSIDRKAPKVGIFKDMLFEYYKEEKTPFEKACLLAYLALKSIIGNKSYCKCTNAYLLSRMAGYSKIAKKLPKDIKPFSTEYQLRKIITELRLVWGLVYYSRYTRGFYVSFKMELEDLILQAENNRATFKKKQLKDEENEILKRIKNKLNESRP